MRFFENMWKTGGCLKKIAVFAKSRILFVKIFTKTERIF
jgi:hypothetical protein